MKFCTTVSHNKCSPWHDRLPQTGTVVITWPIFLFTAHLGKGDATCRHCRCVTRSTAMSICVHDRLHHKGVTSGSRDLFKFREITDNISETIQNRNIVAVEDEQEIIFAYRMATIPMTLKLLNNRVCQNFFIAIELWMCATVYTVFSTSSSLKLNFVKLILIHF